MPSEILVKRLYIPDCKISLAFFVLYCVVILLAMRGEGGGSGKRLIHLTDTVAMLNKSVFKTVSYARREPLSVLIFSNAHRLDEFLVKFVCKEEGIEGRQSLRRE